MSVEVRATHWDTLRDGPFEELAREYTFIGIGGAGSRTVFEIRVRLAERRAGLFRAPKRVPFVYFVVRPYVLEQNGGAVMQFGLAHEGNVNHEWFAVRVESIASGGNFILLDDARSEHCLSVLSQCEPVTLNLVSLEGERLASLLLENNLQFTTAFALFQIA